jgi:hypothetical protein
MFGANSKRKTSLSRRAVVGLILALLLFGAVIGTVLAGEYILGTGSAEINEAWFLFYRPDDATGTGIFDPFLRISANMDVVEGYNTDFRPLQFQEDSPWTESIRLSEVPQRLADDLADPPPGIPFGVRYREFQLDINQVRSGPPLSLITLDTVEMYTTTNPSLTGYDPGTQTFSVGPAFGPIYDMDEFENNWLVLDYSLSEGSGKRDMRMWIRDDLFSAGPECFYDPINPETCDVFVVLYSRFGGDSNSPNNDGFEEWGVELTEPLAMTLTSFDATCQGSQPSLGWQTANEVGNVGFNVWRSTSSNAPEVQLGFVPSQTPGSATGFDYSFVDGTAESGVAYYYWLEAVGQTGSTSMNGPVSATCSAPTAVTLDNLSADSNGSSLAIWPWIAAALGLFVALGARYSLRRQRS